MPTVVCNPITGRMALIPYGIAGRDASGLIDVGKLIVRDVSDEEAEHIKLGRKVYEHATGKIQFLPEDEWEENIQ